MPSISGPLPQIQAQKASNAALCRAVPNVGALVATLAPLPLVVLDPEVSAAQVYTKGHRHRPNDPVLLAFRGHET